ncbi:phage tail protein [uncultured Megasphaera sp.]|uniref:phage tail protein n=1 Tax=uncultured Megasphaera sp. TaxID=165188 RepID=UPI002596F23D|nr:phage tail protein [uncultured Megasphaera sp.]
MATVGSLGGITFNVSSRRVLTFDNYSRQGNIKQAEHEIIAEKSNMEFTGLEPEEITFDIQLFSQLNVKPEDKLEALRNMRDTGQVVSFILGSSPVSQNKWMIVGLSEKPSYWKQRGKMHVVTVSVMLKEYRVDANTTSASRSGTPWENVLSQISEAQDTVSAYKQKDLDVLDQIDDTMGGIL